MYTYKYLIESLNIQKTLSPSPAGEGWGEEIKINCLYPLIPTFSATVPDVALPPASMQSSLKGEGADTYTPHPDLSVVASILTPAIPGSRPSREKGRILGDLQKFKKRSLPLLLERVGVRRLKSTVISPSP
jgi:hypothetical protein